MQKENRISNTAMEAILKKHKVSGNVYALQRAYRMRKGQEYLASFRDEDGKREVLAMPGSTGMEYVIVDACNDKEKILLAERRMRSGLLSQNSSRKKLVGRLRFLNRKEGWGCVSRSVYMEPPPPDLIETYFFPQGGGHLYE
ncbi:hypothetical protein LJC27_05080 [Christensenellaceae bacterium OttesenSCG-928-M15]|nr:hypothetical protein [Christensenellaceae bacterium OttesenSCG-928-M15]